MGAARISPPEFPRLRLHRVCLFRSVVFGRYVDPWPCQLRFYRRFHRPVNLAVPVGILHGVSVRGSGCWPESPAEGIIISGGALWNGNELHRSTPPLTRLT